MAEISVIMSAHNAERYIAKAIRSILCQSFRDFELLIVNDSSTDSTGEVIGSFDDPRIRLLHNPRNLGLPRSLNRGLKLTRAPWIARLDADDVAKPNRLERQLAYLNAYPETALLGSAAQVIDETSKVIGKWEVPTSDVEIKWALLFSNPMVHSSVIFRREPVLALGGYPEDPGFQFVEDYFLWSRLAASSTLANLAEPLILWREHEHSISRQEGDVQDQQRNAVSDQNIRRILEPNQLSRDDLAAAREALLGPPRRKAGITISRFRQGFHFLERLQDALLAEAEVAPALVWRHRRSLNKKWAQHFLALGLKPDSGLNFVDRLKILLLACQVSLKSLLTNQLSGPQPPIGNH